MLRAVEGILGQLTKTCDSFRAIQVSSLARLALSAELLRLCGDAVAAAA